MGISLRSLQRDCVVLSPVLLLVVFVRVKYIFRSRETESRQRARAVQGGRLKFYCVRTRGFKSHR